MAIFDKYINKMVELNKYKLEKSSLIRHVYRALLQRDRTYAAFEIDRIVPLVEKLVSNEPLAEIPVTGTCSLYIVLCGCHYAVYGGIKP